VQQCYKGPSQERVQSLEVIVKPIEVVDSNGDEGMSVETCKGGERADI
jgi:hypothetical protein